MSSENIVTIGDHTIDTSLSVYMRSRNILVKARGLKPNTAFYPFFDGVNVNKFCVPASKLTVKLTSTDSSFAFDSERLAINASSDEARIIGDTVLSLRSEKTSRTCLDHGDVIESTTIGSSTNGHTAVVVYAGPRYLGSDNSYYQDLRVVNFKDAEGRTKEPQEGGFTNGDTLRIKGSENLASAIVTATAVTVDNRVTITNNEGNAPWAVPQDINKYVVYSLDSSANRIETIKTQKFLSDANGNLQLIFWIPDVTEYPDFPAFTTGSKTFKLVDSLTNTSSQASTTFTSSGIVSVSTNGISNTLRTLENSSNGVDDNDTVISDWSDTSIKSGSDIITNPLAQTFLVKGCEGGCFLTKVDIYFASVDRTTNSAVTLQIRNVVNGYPTSSYIKASEVTIPVNDIKLSSTKASYTEVVDSVAVDREYYAPDTPTTFTFTDPVYLENGNEYAITLISESANYRVWIAELGGSIITSGVESDRIINDKPYYGSLFKSQNASAWEVESTQYLLTTLYYARFDRSVNGSLTASSINNIEYKTLQKDPLEFTANSPKVRVWSSNHGFYGKYENKNNSRSNLKVVLKSDDYPIYESDGSVNVAKNTLGGTNGVHYSHIFGPELEVVDYDIESFTVSLTNGNVSYTPKVSGYFGGENVKYCPRINFDIIEPHIETSSFSSNSVNYKLNYYKGGSLNSSEAVGSAINTMVVNSDANNEMGYPGVVDVANDKNIELKVDFSTLNDRLTPVIDKDRLSATLITNVIDYPSVDSIKTEVVTSNKLNTVIDLGASYRIKTIHINSAVNTESPFKLSYNTTSASLVDMNSRTYTATPIITQTQARYISVNKPCTIYCEFAHAAQYVTNAFGLEDNSNYLKVLLDASVPSCADIDVYYKLANVDLTKIQSMEAVRPLQWTLFKPSSNITKNETGTFDQVNYVIDLSNYSESMEFNVFQLKIIMKSKNSSKVPLIKNLRMIACYA